MTSSSSCSSSTSTTTINFSIDRLLSSSTSSSPSSAAVSAPAPLPFPSNPAIPCPQAMFPATLHPAAALMMAASWPPPLPVWPTTNGTPSLVNGIITRQTSTKAMPSPNCAPTSSSSTADNRNRKSRKETVEGKRKTMGGKREERGGKCAKLEELQAGTEGAVPVQQNSALVNVSTAAGMQCYIDASSASVGPTIFTPSASSAVSGGGTLFNSSGTSGIDADSILASVTVTPPTPTSAFTYALQHHQMANLSGRRKRRHRTIFTEEQLQMLEDTFRVTQYPEVGIRERLAEQCELREERVEVWFKNRRAKARKKTREANQQQQQLALEVQKSPTQNGIIGSGSRPPSDGDSAKNGNSEEDEEELTGDEAQFRTTPGASPVMEATTPVAMKRKKLGEHREEEEEGTKRMNRAAEGGAGGMVKFCNKNNLDKDNRCAVDHAESNPNAMDHLSQDPATRNGPLPTAFDFGKCNPLLLQHFAMAQSLRVSQANGAAFVPMPAAMLAEQLMTMQQHQSIGRQ